MSPAIRQTLSASAIALTTASALAAAVTIVFAYREARATVADLETQMQALQAREHRLAARPGRNPDNSPLFDARTVTLAGAALQQRLESAVLAAKGRLVSSRLDVAPQGEVRRLALAAELTIAEPDVQRLLFDLETGRPYLFVDTLEARAPDVADGSGELPLHVSLAVSGEWSGAE